MKKLLLIISCLLSISAFAQIDTSSINKKDAQGRKQGEWKHYEKGKLAYEGQFKDNVPYGTFKYYFPNGKMKSITEFREGVHLVHATVFHENGHKASEGVFIDQLKDGTWNYYSNTDQLIAIENYNKGLRTGEWKTFSNETGLLLEETNYLNDKKNGVHKTYYFDGTVSLEENYLEGKLNGKCATYYPKTGVATSGEYLKGVRTGSWNYHDANGKIRSTVEYKNGVAFNTFVYLYTNGAAQKINQNVIAYFLKSGEKSVAVLTKGNKIPIDESLDEVQQWADELMYTRISPSVLASNGSIVGIKDLGDGAISIRLFPATEEPVYSEGDDAKMVKALFNSEKPKEE